MKQHLQQTNSANNISKVEKDNALGDINWTELSSRFRFRTWTGGERVGVV